MSEVPYTPIYFSQTDNVGGSLHSDIFLPDRQCRRFLTLRYISPRQTMPEVPYTPIYFSQTDNVGGSLHSDIFLPDRQCRSVRNLRHCLSGRNISECKEPPTLSVWEKYI